jgi:hypothetical protein
LYIVDLFQSLTIMLYIHHTTCISPQQTFSGSSTGTSDDRQHGTPQSDRQHNSPADNSAAATRPAVPSIDLQAEHRSANNTLKVIEPSHEGIPKNALRRMTKSVRMGVGSALPLIQRAATDRGQSAADRAHSSSLATDPSTAESNLSVARTAGIDGIIIGTANAGMEESIQFMKQIIDYGGGPLAPGAFVQSTPNTIASQVSFLSQNKAYNITHVQSGLAFENAMIDAGMQLAENPLHTYLLGGVDEIGAYNYNIDFLGGWYKKEPLSSEHLYASNSPGSLAGEGAAMFLVNNQPTNALAKVRALTTLHSDDPSLIASRLQHFVDTQVPAGEKIDLLLSGENGDNRLLPYYLSCEAICDAAWIARFKHMCGEYPTASAFALWLACQALQGQSLPLHMIKKQAAKANPVYKNVLIYNTYKGSQHSIMLVSGIS